MAAAYRGTAELALENEAQGTAFIDAVSAAWPTLELEQWTDLTFKQEEITVSILGGGARFRVCRHTTSRHIDSLPPWCGC